MIHRLALAVALSISAHGVEAQTDPVGPIALVGRYDGGQGVLLGRDQAGRTVCYRREEGSSHRLDIGVGPQGAFLRLDTPEPRDATAREPVRVYAGHRSGDRFTVLAVFEGTARHHVPGVGASGFVLVAAEAAAFLAVVAAARDQFLVVESRQAPAAREYVAIYEFTKAAADAMLACAVRHVRA